MNLTEKVMNKIAIIDQYKILYGEKDINEYFDLNKTYEGIEKYLENKMNEKNGAIEPTARSFRATSTEERATPKK